MNVGVDNSTPRAALLLLWLRPVAVFLVGLLLVVLAIGLSRETGNVAFIWFLNAFVFAILLRRPLGEWPLLILAAAAANVAGNRLFDDDLWFCFGVSLANQVEIVVGALLARSWIAKPGLRLTILALLQMLLVYIFLAIPLGAVLGSLVVVRAFGVSFLDVFTNWWLGDTIGLLLVGVLGLLLNRIDLRPLQHLLGLLDFLLTFTIVVVISYLLMAFVSFPFIYICTVLTAIAYRDGALRTIIHANLLVLVLGSLWWGHYIDLSHLLLDASAKGTWAATALSCLFPTLLGMAIEDMRSQQRAVSDLTSRLSLASGALRLGIWDWNVDTGELHWDAQMFALYDLPPGSLPLTVAQWRPRLHPEDLAQAETALTAALAGERDYDAEFRLLRPDGSVRHIRAAGVVLQEDNYRRFVGVNWDITSEREALQAMRDAQIRLHGVINAASEFSIIATDTAGTIQVFSEGAERMLGYSAEETIGRTTPAPLHIAEEVMARSMELSAEYGRPIEGFDVFVEKARHGESESREWTYVRKDGGRFPVKLVVTSIRDSTGNITGFLGVAQDISEQKKSQQALLTTNRVLEHQIGVAQRSRLEFENLFELAPGALLVVDKHGSIIKANTQSHDLFGYDHGDLVGRSIEELIPRENRNTHVAKRGEFMRHPKPRLMASERVLSGMKKTGEHFLAEITLSPLLINGAPCTIAIARDVTSQKQAEKALARAKEEAEIASKAKSEFLANMSHEIRTPLNAILGTAQLLERTTLGEEPHRYVKMIRTSGTSLLGVINDILDFSKIEAGKMELANEIFDLDDVLASIANLMSINVGNKDIELAIGVAPNTPRHWIGDSLRLNQILVNLVGNALKFTEQGEIVLNVSLQQTHHKNGVLKFSIRDTGLGMTVEQQQRLFQAFSQADTSMTRRFGGTGLGLVICQRLVRMMEGEVQLHSVAGAGTEFQFTVKMEIAPTQPTALATSQSAPQRILIVDGNKVTQKLLASMIREWNWYAHVESGCVAAERHLREQHPYDAVLVDWKLPGKEMLRQFDYGSDPLKKILMVSAYGRNHSQDLEQWQSVLIKPVTASLLFNALQHGGTVSANTKVNPAAPVSDQLQGINILLVEDNELNQVVACGLLEQAGALIDVVENGKQAVEWLRDRGKLYQLVLMDVQMPVMDGFTATRLIRDELKMDIPIIAMSAGVMLAEQQQCLESGMNGFIAKPVDFHLMLETLLQHLPQRPAPQTATPTTSVANTDVDTAINAYFSPDKMLSFVRGKPKRLRDVMRMIEVLVEKGVTPIEEGRALLDQGALADAARFFHTLKGSMGNLGAQHMWTAAEALEKAIKENQMESIETLLANATDCLQQTVAAARQWLLLHPEYSQTDSETQALTPEALQQLRGLLEENNIQACDLFDTLRDGLAAKLTPAQISELQHAFQALDFKAALKVIAPLS